MSACVWLGRTEHCSLELKGSQMSLGARAKPTEKGNHRPFIRHSSQTTISDGGEDTGQSNKTRLKMLPPDKSNLFFQMLSNRMGGAGGKQSQGKNGRGGRPARHNPRRDWPSLKIPSGVSAPPFVAKQPSLNKQAPGAFPFWSPFSKSVTGRTMALHGDCRASKELLCLHRAPGRGG